MLKMKLNWVAFFLVVASPISTLLYAQDSGKGIGPVTSLQLEALNPALVEKGKASFQSKCSACHKIDERYVGPAIQGVTTRRSPEWIMNMILNPQEMTQKDPIASKLLEEYMVQMTYQNVSQEEARAILEYFRSHDAVKEHSGATKNSKKKH